MIKYLFIFAITPVQSFITQVRKTQDLYAGSSLLSYLIDRAMSELENLADICEFIFPSKKIKSKPNRFIAQVEISGEARRMQEIGDKVKKCVEDEFIEEGKSLFEKGIIDSNSRKTHIKELFSNQLKDHLQIYWLALPITDYQEDYAKIEKYLGAIKNVKVFSQIKNGKGEIGRKCSVCGQRNVVVYKMTKKEKEDGLKQKGDGLLKKLYLKEEDVAFYKSDDLKMQPSEGLCAICFTKRFLKEENFPSTARIALLDWLENIPQEVQCSYKSLFKNFDEQLYFEENLREEYLKKYYLFKDDESFKKAKDLLEELYKEYKKPNKYYALIMLDGDSMGKWLKRGVFKRSRKAFKVSQKIDRIAWRVCK